MTPETNHDVEISIYHDFLEDQGIIVDRDPELQDQWCCESKYSVGSVVVGGVGVVVVGGRVGVVVVGGDFGGVGVVGVVGGDGVGGSAISDISGRVGG